MIEKMSAATKIFTPEQPVEIVSMVVYHNKIIVATRTEVWELEETDDGFIEVKLRHGQELED